MVTSVVEQSDGRAGETPTPQSLPPSERDFAIFRAVVVEGASTRAAAEAFSLSQTRIMQIRNRVAEWIAEIEQEIPVAVSLSPEGKLRLAAHIAEGRSDFLYSQAVTAWHASKRPHTTVRLRAGVTGEQSVTRDCHGDPRYLLAAMRLVERGMRVVAPAVRESGVGDRESGGGGAVGNAHDSVGNALCGEALQNAAPDAPRETSPTAPPVRDCSRHAETVVQISREPAGAIAAMSCQDELSDEERRRRRAFFGGPEGGVVHCSQPARKIRTRLVSKRSPAHNVADHTALNQSNAGPPHPR